MVSVSQASIEAALPASNSFGSFAKQELLAARSGIQFAFREFSQGAHTLRSAAAASVEAVWLGGTPNWDLPQAVQLIKRDLLVACPFNPRHFVSHEAMAKTFESIAAQGIHTPLEISQLDDEQGLVLSGHRRLWVCHALGLDLLPCKLDPRGVLDELQVREAVIRYNEGQEKPAPIDRAQSIFEYIRASGANQSEVAARFNLSPAEVCNMLRLLTLPDRVKELVNSGAIPVATALVMARYTNTERANIALAERVLAEKLSARQVREILQKLRSAQALQMGNRGHPKGQAESQARDLKEVKIELPGIVPVTVSISSKKAALSPEQISASIEEALSQIPIELEVHHHQSSGAAANDTRSDQNTSLLLPTIPPTMAPMARAGENGQGILRSKEVVAPTGTHQPSMSQDNPLRNGASLSVKAIFMSGKPDWSQPTVVQLIHISNLVPHPNNPRKLVSPSAMQSTLESIRESGIHTPLHIAPFPGDPAKAYVLGGHRRLWCATKLGLELLPCRLDARANLTALQVQEALIRDNEGQEKPAPVDRAKSYADYLRVSGYPIDVAARRLGSSVAAIEKSLKLLTLPETVQDMLNCGQMSEAVGLAICDYPGSSEAKTALALRAVMRGLSAAQIRKLTAESRISLDGLALGPQRSRGSERLWVTSGDKRVVVHVQATSGTLDGTELRRSLHGALSKLSELRGTGKEPAANPNLSDGHSTVDAAIGASNGLVKLTNLASKNPTQFRQILVQWLGRFVIKDGEDVLAASDIALALNRRVSDKDLRNFGFKTSGETIANARRWYHEPAEGTPDTLPLIRILEYWGATLAHIRSLSPSKREFSYVEIAQLPYDAPVSRGTIKRGRLAEILRSRLEAFPDVIERRVLTLIDADRMRDAGRSTWSSASQALISRADLELRGVRLHKEMRWYLSFWKNSARVAPPTVIASNDQFTVAELHAYYTYALSRLIELSGGAKEARVGRSELERRHIAYSANVQPSSASNFGWLQVFSELNGNIERLAEMLKQQETAAAEQRSA
ncbi:MAG: ParB/RepB/Spo0J family partition protein [Bdellovibrionota bacterium]|nr:MAG: ParB/RepB/Spo0J family partition protein [Bdellovibrionota bacterium]